VPSYYDIGVVHRAVTTRSPAAQLWFDRSLALTYGLHHDEAIGCFDRAIELAPYCAMAYWGKSYALGPNYSARASRSEPVAARRRRVYFVAACGPSDREVFRSPGQPAAVSGREAKRESRGRWIRKPWLWGLPTWDRLLGGNGDQPFIVQPRALI
jgi:hypothetical protein